VVREIDGIPVCLGGERIARYRRGKKPKPPMAELGIEKLKPQQKLALSNKFELGMSNRQAAIQAGYKDGTSANHILPRLLQRKPIQDALKARGITDFKIADVIAEGLEQSVTKGIVSAKRKWNGITLKYGRKSPDVSPGFGFNRPRHPERTVLYRVLFHHFERFVAEYKGLVVAKWANNSNRGKGDILTETG